MNDRIKRHYDAFTSIVTYGTANAAQFGPKSALPAYFTQVDGIVKNMDAAKAGQLGGSGADVAAGLLAALQDDLQSIGGIARAVDTDQPGLNDTFPTVGTTEQSILSTADNYLTQLEIQPADNAATQTTKTNLANVFIAHEMPDTFVEDLRADRDAVKPAGDEVQSKSTGKVENTAALNLLSHQGMQVRAKIVAALNAKYARQPDKLRAAQSATHVERAPQRSKAVSNGATKGAPSSPAKITP
jgi:hypothetical protein